MKTSKTSKTPRRFVAVMLTGTLLTTTVAAALAACGGDGTPTDAQSSDAETFDYSAGLDENGFWADVTALDLVTLPDYTALEVPAESHTVSDEEVQAQVDSLLASYQTQEEVTDRAIADGDTVNIDYVGTVDGEEFDGGSTGGAGTTVTAGSTDFFVDDFLTQIIGHEPGDSFDVEVTLPDDYEEASLAGKDAVFATTINHIVETVTPELTEDFVAENLTGSYGWTTVDEMTAGIRADLELSAITNYIGDYFATQVAVATIPDVVRTAQEGSLVAYYESMAAQYGMELEDYLSQYAGFDDVDALIESNADSITSQANYAMVVQAIAEDAGITVTDDDLAAYFLENMGDEDYSSYETQYGLPYLKLVVLSQKVIDRTIEGATLL